MNTRLALQAAVCGLLSLGGPLAAQSLPAYAPLNPMAARRSGLASQPYLDPGRRWRVGLVLDYASLIEYADLGGVSYLLDAEVLRLQLSVARNLGSRGFVVAEASFNGAYNGFLDGFLDWYHRTTGFRVAARELRPTNEFGYALHPAGGGSYQYEATSGFLGDVRLGAGLRHSAHWQSMLSATLPTGNGPAGYRRGVVSLNATTTLRSNAAKRLIYEGSLGFGYTPRHGDVRALQNTTFWMLTQGARARVSGALHAYANVIYHSAYYHDSGTTSLDRRDLTLDVGGVLRFRKGPQWSFGLTEDLEPSGPAIDVGFRFGARW